MTNFSLMQKNMVENQIKTSGVKNYKIIEAIKEVPKEFFCETQNQDYIYLDSFLYYENGYMLLKNSDFAKMLDILDIKDTDIVLDVSCIYGYSVAVISKIAGVCIGVVDRKEHEEKANEKLVQLELDNTLIVNQNFDEIYDKQAPYDKIIVNCFFEDLPNSYISHLKEGGKIVFIKKKSENSKIIIGSVTSYEKTKRATNIKSHFDIVFPKI